MAGMKRFVTYIYSYEDKKKGSNTGFAKIESRGDECRIEIHLRGVYTGRATCKVYLFKEDGQEMVGFPIGELRIINGNGDFGIKIRNSQIGEPGDSIFDMQGIFLMGEEDRIFATRWKEGGAIEVCKERFREWLLPQERDTDRNGRTEGRDVVAASVATEPSPTTAQTKVQSAAPAFASQPYQHMAGEEHVIATEIPMRNVFPRYDWNAVWEQLKQSHPLLAPFVDPDAFCVQIELKDLRELPKRYWYLGNNSFLLHGFFNYQYLIVGKREEDRWFIGVPGIYQNQERVMAAIFGFPEFIPTATEDTQADEQEPINRFGFWYRYIEE